MRLRYLFILMMLIVLVFCSENSEPITANNKLIRNVIKDSTTNANYQEGKTLFVANCDACHRLHGTDQMFFNNLNERWKEKKTLYDFIRNPQEVIKKDAYAKAMYEEYNHVSMTAFAWMTDKQIELTLHYIAMELSSKK
ncbi:MAG: cytochrome c [Pedobacter sp.]|nr:cytochrome c [Chitinophagaceae bacterium]